MSPVKLDTVLSEAHNGAYVVFYREIIEGSDGAAMKRKSLSLKRGNTSTLPLPSTTGMYECANSHSIIF